MIYKAGNIPSNVEQIISETHSQSTVMKALKYKIML